MPSLQLRLDCAGVSLQSLCMLDRITVLSNSSKYSLAVPLSNHPFFAQEALKEQWSSHLSPMGIGGVGGKIDIGLEWPFWGWNQGLSPTSSTFHQSGTFHGYPPGSGNKDRHRRLGRHGLLSRHRLYRYRPDTSGGCPRDPQAEMISGLHPPRESNKSLG